MSLDSVDAEVRTRSVPTAAHLVALGYPLLGVKVWREHGALIKTMRFSPAARGAINAYMAEKMRLDTVLEDAVEETTPAIRVHLVQP